MAKIKITALTDKASDEEILAKLKKIGVKIKDKSSEETGREEDKEQLSPAGETLVEKRVASTIIRRRVQKPPVKEKEELKEEKKEIPEETKEGKAEKKATPRKKAEEKERTVKEKEEEAAKTAGRRAKAEPKTAVKERSQEQEEQAVQEVSEEKTGTQKGGVEHLEEDKEKEITKVLEEAYKQDLEKDFTLAGDGGGEERQKKKTEKLLKKIEEQELEETKVKKKGMLKRKVVIKEEDLYAFRRQRPKGAPFRKDRRDRPGEKRVVVEEEEKKEIKPARKFVKVSDAIQVGELAKRMNLKAQDIIKTLFPLGIVATVNKSIDYDTAYLAATELGYEVERIVSIEDAFLAREEEEKINEENLKPRSPVVTIMGHVDHGKTLLLDTIRNTNVAGGEAGGITQHIGAYKVNVNSKEIVFVDTPGHEAFTAMRARGALVTDIVILVVAADDGVMPQTIEAINHARSAEVPIIVAINKIDKQNANPDKVMKELAEYNLISEEWGGSTLVAKISAKKKEGIEELLELIILQAEMLELKTNPDKLAKGTIIESELDKGHGAVGTVIIQEGTLKIQDPFIAGMTFGRVRAMVDDKGKRITQAPPSTPVVVVGFQDVPHGGDRFIVTTEEHYARELSKFRQEKVREKDALRSSRTTLEDLYSKIGESKVILNVILKGDVRGTIDAIVEALKKLSTDTVEVQIAHGGVGTITETDVNLAMATGAIIIGFNVKPNVKAQALAEQEKIEIRTYSIIYEMIDDVRKAMEGLLEPKIVEVNIGKAEVRKVFAVSKIGTIAGSFITEGKVTRNALVKVIRNKEILFTGKISSLKRFKDDAREVLAGYECGLSLEAYNDLQEGDAFEFFVEEKEKQTL